MKIWLGILGVMLSAIGFTMCLATLISRHDPSVRVSHSLLLSPEEPSIAASSETRTVLPEESPGEQSCPAIVGQTGPVSQPTQGLQRGSTSVPLVFSSLIVKDFIKLHPNSPLRLIPPSATPEQLRYVEKETEEIVGEWQVRRDELLSQFGDDLLGFSQDPRVHDNDLNRQQRLMSLIRSVWP